MQALCHTEFDLSPCASVPLWQLLLRPGSHARSGRFGGGGGETWGPRSPAAGSERRPAAAAAALVS